jgi:hypothetical protein
MNMGKWFLFVLLPIFLIASIVVAHWLVHLKFNPAIAPFGSLPIVILNTNSISRLITVTSRNFVEVVGPKRDYIHIQSNSHILRMGSIAGLIMPVFLLCHLCSTLRNKYSRRSIKPHVVNGLLQPRDLSSTIGRVPLVPVSEP